MNFENDYFSILHFFLELVDYKLPDPRVTKPQGYRWYIADWGECSVTCGGGQKKRETICSKEDKDPADYSNCAGEREDTVMMLLIGLIWFDFELDLMQIDLIEIEIEKSCDL